MKQNYDKTATVSFSAEQAKDAQDGNGQLTNPYFEYLNARPNVEEKSVQQQDPSQNNQPEPTPIDEPSEPVEESEDFTMMRVDPIKLDDRIIDMFGKCIGDISAMRYSQHNNTTNKEEDHLIVYDVIAKEPCFDDARQIKRMIDNAGIQVTDNTMISVRYPEVCSAVPIKSESMINAISDMQMAIELEDTTCIRRVLDNLNKSDSQAAAALLGIFNKRVTAYLNMFCSDTRDAQVDIYNDIDIYNALSIINSGHPKEIQVMIDRHGVEYIERFKESVMAAIKSVVGDSRINVLNHANPRDLAYSSRANGMTFIDSENTPSDCYHVVQDQNYTGNYMDIIENYTVLLKNKRHILTSRIVNSIGFAGMLENKPNIVKLANKKGASLELAAVSALMNVPCETTFMCHVGGEESKSPMTRSIGKTLRGEILVK